MSFLKEKKLQLRNLKSSKMLKMYFAIAFSCLAIFYVSILIQNLYKPENKFFYLPENLVKEVIVISSGDNLYSLLTPYKFKLNDINSLIDHTKPYFDLKNIKLGQKFSITYRVNNDLKEFMSLQIHKSVDKRVNISRNKEGGYKIDLLTLPLKREYINYSGTIETSLIDAAVKQGAPYKNIIEAINAHSYDVDFQREIQKGNKFHLLVERLTSPEDGSFSYGKTLYSSLKLDSATLNIYLFQMEDGSYEFINEDFTTVKRALLKTPVPASRISSRFGLRMHPVLGYSKMHKGTDFAAPPGTPIYASGSGVIREIGRKGNYGKYIRIQHNNQTATAYAHLRSFAIGLSTGKRVKQGEVIGTVGSTGRSTGPHLHYEVIINGRQVNPQSVKSDPAKTLKGEDKEKFIEHKSYIDKLASTA